MGFVSLDFKVGKDGFSRIKDFIESKENCILLNGEEIKVLQLGEEIEIQEKHGQFKSQLIINEELSLLDSSWKEVLVTFKKKFLETSRKNQIRFL